MKIIYLISRARISGPVNQGLNILTGIKLNGKINAALVTLAPENPKNSWLNKYKEEGIEVFTLNIPLWKTFFCLSKVKNLLLDNKIDVIHSSGFRANFVSACLSKRYIKISTQRSAPRDIGEKFPKIIQPILTKLYLSILRRMDVNVACSKSLGHVFLTQHNMSIPYVQNGVNTDYFLKASEDSKMKLRSDLKINPRNKTFLILGSLRDRKNNQMAIRVFNQLSNYDCQLLIVGDGPERSMLKSLAKNPKIMFMGSTNSPIDYLQASDYLISCSKAEGLPNTVLEALSCGLPCLLSDIEPHRELIGNTKVGCLFSLNSDEELLTSVKNALNWSDDMGDEARNLAIEKYDRKIIARNYERIYQEEMRRRNKSN
ncbi:MAG: glycosyltransferase family 4 protein [Clostridia bacterium]|nr:glycosyltransferase family 4 protein [Clostridia bacterium]